MRTFFALLLGVIIYFSVFLGLSFGCGYATGELATCMKSFDTIGSFWGQVILFPLIAGIYWLLGFVLE